jgi:hypothetical protein
MNSIVLSWWNKLSETEQDMLLEFLYDLDLSEYFVLDNDGTIVERLR